MHPPRLLRLFVLLGAAALAPRPALAHPGTGIVVDAKGRVFFVSTFQNVVMMIDTNGKTRTFVRDERLRLPHHLVLGRDGSLYVASDYDGKVWRIAENGSLSEYFDTRTIAGRNRVNIGSWGDPFTIDAAGNVIALASPGDSSLVRVAKNGTVTPIAPGTNFRRLHYGSLAWGRDGALYVTDETRIWRIVGDTAVRIASRQAPILLAAGLAIDSARNIYVADPYAGRVFRLAADGALNSPPSLADARIAGATGVTIGPDGAVYVLGNLHSGLEVWRIRGDDVTKVYWQRDASAYGFGIALTLVPLLLVMALWRHRPTSLFDWIGQSLLVSIVVIGLYSLAGDFFIFTWLRHPILLVYLVAVWKSHQALRAARRESVAV